MTMMIAIVPTPCKLQMCRSYVKIYCLCLEQRGEDEQRRERERRAIAAIVCLFWGLRSLSLWALGAFCFLLYHQLVLGYLHADTKPTLATGVSMGEGWRREGSCCSDHIIRVAAAAVAGSSFLYFSARLKEVLWQVIFISSRFAAAAAAVACGQSQQR